MSALGGFVTGVIGLSLLEAVVSSSAATDNATGVFTGAANLVRRLASPAVPAIPDLRIPANQRAQLPPGTTSSTAPAPSSAPSAAASFTAPASRLPVSVST